jgi:hypothetical protein
MMMVEEVGGVLRSLSVLYFEYPRRSQNWMMMVEEVGGVLDSTKNRLVVEEEVEAVGLFDWIHACEALMI